MNGFASSESRDGSLTSSADRVTPQGDKFVASMLETLTAQFVDGAPSSKLMSPQMPPHAQWPRLHPQHCDACPRSGVGVVLRLSLSTPLRHRHSAELASLASVGHGFAWKARVTRSLG